MMLWSLLWLVRWRLAVTPEVAPHRLMHVNSSPLARMLTFWDYRYGDSCRPIISVSAPHAAAGASLQTVQYACILGSVVEGRQRWIQWYRCCTVNRRFWGDLEAWRAMTNGANWGYHTSSSPPAQLPLANLQRSLCGRCWTRQRINGPGPPAAPPAWQHAFHLLPPPAQLGAKRRVMGQAIPWRHARTRSHPAGKAAGYSTPCDPETKRSKADEFLQGSLRLDTRSHKPSARRGR